MSESILNRTYTPPVLGSFDPYTAAMEGALPAFFSYAPPNVSPTQEALSIPPDSEEGGAPSGTSGAAGDMPSVSTPSPDQSISAALGSLGTGLSVATGPMGLATALGSLGLSDYLGREPSFNMGARGTLSGLGQAIGLVDRPAAPVTPAFYSEDAAAAAAGLAEAAAEANAMAQGLQSPAAGFGSYGFGTDPGVGRGSGDFSAINQTERDDAVAAALGHEHGLDAEGQPAGTDPGTDPGESNDTGSPSNLAGGGLVAFANGGLVPLAGGGKIAIGPGGGLDDLIPTSINGRRAAALSDGEFVIPADVVSMMGDGSSNAGARRFYDLVKQVRQTKTGTARQAGPLPVGDILKRSLAR